MTGQQLSYELECQGYWHAAYRHAYALESNIPAHGLNLPKSAPRELIRNVELYNREHRSTTTQN